MTRPLCFVLMPFGKKPDAASSVVDFDAVYRDLIALAVAEAGLEPVRIDEEMTGEIIHKPMFECLIHCPYAVADLTTANANVFYQLGLRHAVRPRSTVLIFSEGGRLPFDVAPLRGMPYHLTPEGTPKDIATAKAALVERLREARDRSPDSPIFQLVEGMRAPEIDRVKTHVFLDRVPYATQLKERLAIARNQGSEALRALERELDTLADQESGVVIDLFLSYRAVKAWKDMIALVSKMSPPLAATVLVQEQLALALSRVGRGDKAEQVLRDLIARRGPSSETYGILGRIFKNQWEDAARAGDNFLARGLLDKPIDAYLKAFESDWRDAYPGVNAVALMELKEPPDPRREKLIPVVAYAVERRIANSKPDYWDHATRLELAVLAKDEQAALAATTDALAAVRESWEPETTACNLRLIREARERRVDVVSWAQQIEEELDRRARA